MLRSLLLAAALVPLTAAGCASSTPAATADTTAPPDTATSMAVSMPEPVPMTAGTAPDGSPAAGHGLDVVERIGLGETVQPYGQPVTFVGVDEDSRCPENTTCVWEGRAVVTVRIGDDLLTLTAPHGTPRAGETATGASGTTEVQLVGVHPYPGSAEAEAGEPVEIAVTIRETAK